MRHIQPIVALLLTSLLLAGLAPAQKGKKAAPVDPPSLKELQTKIDEAIHRGVDAILREQQHDGTWAVNQYGYPVGPTALFTYTLLKCGLDAKHPSVARALGWLSKNLSQKTYGAACQLMAFEATKDKKYKKQMKELTARILEWERSGAWAYPGSEIDLSNSQYAALGLRAARMAGIKIPRAVALRMIDQTFQHQEKAKVADVPKDRHVEDGYERAGGQATAAGFAYRIPKTNRGHQAPTGSMTTAGIAVMLISRDLLDGKLPRSMKRRMERSLEDAENWMRVHWSVKTNPPRSGQHYYYLYGLERVGDIARREVFAGRYWYREGAHFLVGAQKRDTGIWNNLIDSSFALLFLKRASWVGTVTGAGGTDRNQRVYLASADNAEIKLRGAGNPTMSLWIAGFNDKKLAKRFPKNAKNKKGEQEVVVSSVEYLIDGKLIHRAEGNKKSPWDGEPYGYKHEFRKRGRYSITARIHAKNPDAGKANEAETVILESPLLVVEVLDLPDLEANRLNEAIDRNKLRGRQMRVTYSSCQHRWNNKQIPWFADGRLSTGWVTDGRSVNEIPWIKIAPKPEIRCSEIILWPHQADAKIKKVEVYLNGGKRPKRVDVADPRKAIRVPFRRRQAVSSIEIKVTQIEPAGNNRRVGFAEIILR